MFKSILIATDGSELSLQAVTHGLELARTFGAKATAVIVEPVFPHYMLDRGFEKSTKLDVAVKSLSTKVLDKVKDIAASTSTEIDTVAVENDHPWEAICDVAVARKCDLIVMASHGRTGVAAVMLGSQTHKVLNHTKIPVLVYR